ncbi:MAG: hypothetical protein HYW25_02985 [Candidatus Aenigmarchaeota archaeon]|nr:hypothetical protein [Candidatus Aenigmarchaeota archaeon]
MDAEKLREEVEKRRKAGWIDVWMAFETLAVKKEVAESSLQDHIEKMSKVKDMLICEKVYKDCIKTDKIPFKLKEKLPQGTEAWSQVAEVRAFCKDLFTLVNIVMVYGPSAIEIHSPKDYKMKTDEMQNITNLVAGIMHDFASAGVGGLVISGERK